MKKYSLLILVYFIISPSLQAAPLVAGVITQSQGKVFATREGKRRPLFVSSSVFQGDQLHTEKKARLRLLMIDGSQITLGEKTNFLIQEYSFPKGSNSGIVSLNLKQGFFRTITSKFRRTKRRFRIRTALATIGVKGTDFWGGFWSNELFEVALLEGTALEIFNEGGKVVIDQVGFGTSIKASGIAPSKPKQWPDIKLQKAIDTVRFR
ncbi:MAG: hypothetical protein COB67_01905 [SAR324 cluster bacterium]|uniref:FecR protein domain-containing protein n=1 Tax=SAR324 cluster bacterium TaxID=2024889 RepID=A0A2A4TBB7_9DELT|nr:MAG: hypothetical protein COB67_01905 [SAR324 cluster bacterium]